MAAELLDVRPGGIVERFCDGRVVTVEQDVTDVLDACREGRNASGKFKGFRKPDEFRKVAEIPTALVEVLKAQGMDIIEDPEAMLKFLCDKSYEGFRCTSDTLEFKDLVI